MRSCFLSVIAGLIASVGMGVGQVPKPPATSTSPAATTMPPRQQEPGPETRLGGKNLQQWIQDCQHPTDPSIRLIAVQTIPWYGRAASNATSAIIKLLSEDRDAGVRMNAAQALEVMTITDQRDIAAAVAALASRLGADPNDRNSLEDQQAIVRYRAALALARFGPEARSAIPRLLHASRDPNSWEVRKAAVLALASVGRPIPGQGPNTTCLGAILARLSSDPSFEVRREAADVLGAIGQPTQPADLQAVVKGLQDCIAKEQDHLVTISAHVAMIKLGDPSSMEQHLVAIARLLKSPRLPVRLQAARVLGEYGEKARSRLPDLIEALNDQDPEVVHMAIGSIARMGDAAQAAIPALTGVAEKHREEMIRKLAKEALDFLQKTKQPPKK